ncbi:hypothetical protein GCM10022234_10910 [Aeromicrobium panaciterrae]|uniref:DUF2834 domain-containing protein n=1 Tax=Aeromicrobium panaciterrae TaxID=363861 RepID=UPI0031D5E327
MTERIFRAGLITFAVVSTVLFAAIIPPALIDDGFDFWGGALHTFDNPYAAGVSIDVLLAYGVLASWVVYEAVSNHVRRGWIALLLGLVTGLTVALAAYLLIRLRHEAEAARGRTPREAS